MTRCGDWLPYKSVFPIGIINQECPEWPAFTGCGFFVRFPPYDHIFFVTAKHCVMGNDEKLMGGIAILLHGDFGNYKTIHITNYFLGKTFESEKFYEDILISNIDVADESLRSYIEAVSLDVANQEFIDCMFSSYDKAAVLVHALGFPDCLRSEYDPNAIEFTSASVSGKVNKLHYKGEGIEVQWFNDNYYKKLSGFSGGAAFFEIKVSQFKSAPVLCGVFILETRLVSMRVVADLIGEWILNYGDVE